ncbi:MAG: hypothetical protein ACI9RG_001341 [Sulfurimonas sp.]|jgi:hypothetical protein
MQPTFNPWIGYFDFMDYVDKFIFLDTVQLSKRSWQTRNKLKVGNQEKLFTIPILKTDTRDALTIEEAKISYEQYDFRDKLYSLIKQNYKEAKYFQEVDPFLKDLIFFKTDSLSIYNINLITNIAKKIGIQTEIITLSTTPYCSDKTKGELILDICDYSKCTTYISPIGSKNYLEELGSKFSDSSIKLLYQNYSHPSYEQLGETFLAYIGIVDLLYNNGFKDALSIIKRGRCYEDR